MRVDFIAYGVPAVQGSTKGFAIPVKDSTGRVVVDDHGRQKHRAVVTHDSKRSLILWRGKIASAAQCKCDGRLMLGGVRLSVDFYLPRPQSLPKRQRLHLKKPDLSKLIRAAEDAMTGIVYEDDKQIVEYCRVRKLYVLDPHETPRAEFTVIELDEMGNERLM